MSGVDLDSFYGRECGERREEVGTKAEGSRMKCAGRVQLASCSCMSLFVNQLQN
jgi:hypothetical protein